MYSDIGVKRGGNGPTTTFVPAVPELTTSARAVSRSGRRPMPRPLRDPWCMGSTARSRESSAAAPGRWLARSPPPSIDNIFARSMAKADGAADLAGCQTGGSAACNGHRYVIYSGCDCGAGVSIASAPSDELLGLVSSSIMKSAVARFPTISDLIGRDRCRRPDDSRRRSRRPDLRIRR